MAERLMFCETDDPDGGTSRYFLVRNDHLEFPHIQVLRETETPVGGGYAVVLVAHHSTLAEFLTEPGIPRDELQDMIAALMAEVDLARLLG